MAYTKPFTNAQKLEAANAYRAFRRNLRTFKKLYPPRTKAERAVLGSYQEAIKVFGTHAALPVHWINAEYLNDLDIAAREAMIEYMLIRQL